MAQTQRSFAELVALLADNTVGAISPQDIRDMLMSLVSPHGKLSRLVSALTSIAAAGTYVKAAGTSQAGPSNYMFTVSDNRLTYTGASQRHFHIVATVSLQSASNNVRLGVKVAKNGVPMEDSVAATLFKSAGDELSISCHADIHLTTNDFIEVFVGNETDATDLTMTECYFFAMGMLEEA